MSINGVLQDLPLADVLQFVHLGRRTGTLYLWQDEIRRAEIGFHDGRIVGAWTPGQKKLGDLLLASGVIDAETLDGALLAQQSRTASPSLGQILLDRGAVERADLHRVIREQIQETVFDLVTWRDGYFHFDVDELHPIDDFGLAPGELLDDLDLNTQMMLLEAARIFDQRHRQASRGEKPTPIEERLQRAGLGRTGDAAEVPHRPQSAAAALPVEALRCQVIGGEALVEALRQGLPDELAQVVEVRAREAGNRLPGLSTPPIVVLDLRHEDPTLDTLAALARTRPAAPVVAVVAGPEEVAAARQAGAVSVVEGIGEDLVAACRNLLRLASHPQPSGTFHGTPVGFGRFRQVVFDVQSGLLSATMALNLMHVISESVERAILFLAQGGALTAVGAFGFAVDGRPLAEHTRGLKLVPAAGSAFEQATAAGEPLSIEYDAAGLPSALAELVGRPASGQVVIFPVLGAKRAISVIYTDNGEREEDIQDIKILELATAQVGVAFENELLRQQLGDSLSPVAG